MHNPLDRILRTRLESVVGQARNISEAAAKEAVNALGVDDAEAPKHLDSEMRGLRNRLRAHARQLGDVLSSDARQKTAALIEEVAYEHWHRMLFARFLAENGLLIYDGVAITLADCAELAEEEHCASLWELASRCAARMLPQIFRLDSPSFELEFAPDRVRELERLLAGIDPATFKASDSLGWLYQFWQSEKKKQINDSEVKIGAKELPAVTQLFTEPYMVSFLLDNALGAWYAAQKITGKNFDHEADARAYASTPRIPLQYLRLVRNEDNTWTPANGSFAQWPKALNDFTLLDPCCGSGHFLVAAFLMLVPMRMELENLDAATAIDKVLSKNLHGLELDPRCVELAAFALALEAWRYPNAGGYRPLPSFHLACDGIAPQMKREEWIRLARLAARNLPAGSDELLPDDNPSLWENQLVTAMEKLYDTFKDAPVLGSLINPAQHGADLFQADFSDVAKVLHDNLAAAGEEAHEAVIAAHGIIKAMELLSKKYTFVITNVPYLARGKQSPLLAEFCERTDKDAKNDLATVFLDRCLEFNIACGTSCLVLPQNWLFLARYKQLREKLIQKHSFISIARLGAGAFQTISGEVVKAILFTIGKNSPPSNHCWHGFDAFEARSVEEKSIVLREGSNKNILQKNLLANPDAAIVFNTQSDITLLSEYTTVNYGSKPGQTDRVIRLFWEIQFIGEYWQLLESSPQNDFYSGKQKICYTLNEIEKQKISEFGVRSPDIWGKYGIIQSQMREMPFSIYCGYIFDNNTSVLHMKKANDQPHLFAFMCSGEYLSSIRKINQKLDVAAHSMNKVPFDLPYWAKVAEKKYPHGLPEPFTDDPTQWLFHGHPCGSVIWDEETKRLQIGADRLDATVLQVAVARLLGYRWPPELDDKMELAPEMREVMKRNNELASFADADGIVCLPSIRGEMDAATRLLCMLPKIYEERWDGTIPGKLLAACECENKTLEYWLREKFFLQHVKLFGHRPFIWQIWDGLRDGFSVLVNYHKLDSKTLQNLIYNYLGDWITRQKSDIVHGVDGAQEKLDAAENLKSRLLQILGGEAPYDIFVRWKPLPEQPVGWNPDLNDGVRLNIRPFITANVLREKPPKLNIKWGKDRGKDVESAPWYSLFHGDRINDHHLTFEQKKKNTGD